MKIFLIAFLLLIIIYVAVWFSEFHRCMKEQVKHNNIWKIPFIDFCKYL